jgi:hypothetical protein
MGYHRKKCNRKRVTNLWNKDPHCHWCGISTKRIALNQVRIQNDSATFDHLYHKSDPIRKTNKGRTAGVLSCYACNQKRGRDAYIKSLPAWNRLLIRYKVPIPVWKIRKTIKQIKYLLHIRKKENEL